MGDITKEILGQNVENQVQFGQTQNAEPQVQQAQPVQQWQPVTKEALPAKTGFWNKFKAFWLQEINVELTPAQQKFEDDMNAFLHKEITFKSVKNFLFKEIKF